MTKYALKNHVCCCFLMGKKPVLRFFNPKEQDTNLNQPLRASREGSVNKKLNNKNINKR